MKNILPLLFFMLCFQTVDAQDKNSFTTYWNNGLHLDSQDGTFKIKMGGRIQYDIMFINQYDSLNAHYTAENGSEFRRARFYTSGTLFSNIKFKFQVDFAPAKVVIKDAYLRFTKIPIVGNSQAGNFKQPFSMEMITSSNNITEMVRPLTNQFDHDRDLGVMIFNDHDLQEGTLNDITFGINWYVNPAVRYTLNYIIAKVENIVRTNILQMLFQVVF